MTRAASRPAALACRLATQSPAKDPVGIAFLPLIQANPYIQATLEGIKDTAAKGGVIAMSRLAAARYAAEGIRVNVLAPGLIDTPMAARAATDPAVLHFLRTKQPLKGGPGGPEECAEAAVFLCSDEARMLTGVVLPVDGGWCVSEGQWDSGRPG